MKKLLVGFFFIFFDFWIRLNAVKIGLVPSFVGYILLIKGAHELAAESPRFGKVRVPAIIMAVWTGISWVMDLLGFYVTVDGGAVIFSLLLSLVKAVIAYWISYQIVAGVGDIETANGTDLRAKRLKSVWLVLVICNMCSIVLSLIPILTFVLMFVMLTSLIVFLCFFAQTSTLYDVMKAARENEALTASPNEDV